MIKVSVVIPVYNSKKYLKETIESILNQTYQNFEIVLIDDCSNDGSLDIIDSIKDNRIRAFKNEKNSGISYSRNRGIEVSKGEYIALLDHDDIALPYRLEYEVAYLDNNKEIDIVGGHHRHIDEYGVDLDKQWNVYLNPNYIKAYLLLDNAVANGSTMFRREFIQYHHIKYKENMYGAEDYMFWVECSLKGTIKNLDKVFLLWRRTATQETNNMIINHLAERNKALGRIRKTALEGTGFILDKIDYSIIDKIFSEESITDNRDEILQLYQTLKKIASQAVSLKLDNAKEVVTMCRKRFGEKIGKAFYLWD